MGERGLPVWCFWVAGSGDPGELPSRRKWGPTCQAKGLDGIYLSTCLLFEGQWPMGHEETAAPMTLHLGEVGDLECLGRMV